VRYWLNSWYMINSLVAMVKTGVTAHGFEHYFLRDEVELRPRFGYKR